MSTEHTELSRTSVGDFLKLVGDEVERASAFLSKTGSRPALTTRPLRKPAATHLADTGAAHQRQQERVRCVDSSRSKALADDSRSPDSLPVVPAPVRPCASPAVLGQEAFLVAAAPEEPLPAAIRLTQISSSHSAESVGPAAATVSSRSASFVRFSRQGFPLELSSIHSAPAAAGDLPTMPSMGALHLSHTTASSAPSSSATSSIQSPVMAQAGRQQPDAAVMLPMPPLDALDLSHTTASSAPSTHSVHPQQVGDDGGSMEGLLQESAPQGSTYHGGLSGSQAAPVPAAACLRGPDDTAQARAACPVPQAASAPRKRSSSGVQESMSSQQQQQQQRRGGGEYAAPPRASSVLKACQADLMEPLLPTVNAQLATANDPQQVRHAPIECLTEQTERQGELKKSHIKVLRWLSQEQTPDCSPMAPSLGGDCDSHRTALQGQQQGTTIGPPLAAHRASNILRAAGGNVQLRNQRMGADLVEPRAVSIYTADPPQLQPLPARQSHQQQPYGEAQASLCTARQWRPHCQQPPLDSGVHSGAVRGNPEQLHFSCLQEQEQPVLLRHTPHKVQQQRPRSALVRLPGPGPCEDHRRAAGHCKPQLRLLRPLQPQSAAVPQRRPHSAGCYPHLPVSCGNASDGHMAGGARGPSAQQPQLALPWHSGQQAMPAVHPQLPGGPGATSIGSIQTAYFGPTTVPAAAPGVHSAHNMSCLQGGLTATDFPIQAVHVHGSSSHGTNQRPAAAPPQPEIDLWSAYLATRATGGNSNMQDLQNVDPADAVGQLRAISSRIKHMQGEITTFLGSSHAPGGQQGLLLAAPSSIPTPKGSEDSTAQAGQTAAERARHQPGADSSAEQKLTCQQPGVFDDDFVMSIKLGADYRALQQQAKAAALAVAAGGTKRDINQHQEQFGKAAAAGMPLGAAAGETAAGKSEAIDRLKGLRASRGIPRVQHDTSIPVMRMPGRRGA